MNKLYDTHMHTMFSGDSEAAPEAMVESAIAKGLAGLCFTDHMDYDYREEPGLFDLDVPAYQKKIAEVKAAYAKTHPDFLINWGVEIGLQKHTLDWNKQFIASYPFDFVIGSSHCVDAIDIYYPVFWEGREEKAGLLQYFEAILENAASDADFDVYGHLDYAVRYAPTLRDTFHWKDYEDVLAEILRTLIGKGKGIEINTAGFKYGLGHPNPTEGILHLYHDLGGEIITIGADGHKPEHVAYDFAKVPGILLDAGFQYFAVFTGRKPTFFPL